jgi:hypothetical protein
MFRARASKHVWGPAAWLTLLAVADGYPETPGPSDACKYGLFLRAFAGVLPCSVCREGFLDEISNRSPTPALLRGRLALLRWVIAAKNREARSRGAPEWSERRAEAELLGLGVRPDRRAFRHKEDVWFLCLGMLCLAALLLRGDA